MTLLVAASDHPVLPQEAARSTNVESMADPGKNEHDGFTSVSRHFHLLKGTTILSRYFRAFCLAATALPILPSTLAYADDNFLNIVQDGNTHSGQVIQTGLGNRAGTDVLPVHQEGFYDDLTLTQSGDNNDIGRSNRGLVQNGTASVDGSPANSATILQQSNGNVIGELVQTTLGTHTRTGNILAVKQLTGGSNTIGSIEQLQGIGDAANSASFFQNGVGNWLANLTQKTTSGGDDNQVTLTVTGNYNGIDPGNQTGVGPLATLANSVGAHSSQIIQDGDGSGGAANIIDLTITGDYNQFGLTQLGTDNSVAEQITGSDNSFAVYQLGQHNQIVSGGVAGDSNDLGIRQVGYSNSASAVLNWTSSDNGVGIGQNGDANTADVSLKGDHGLVGVSQNGNGHYAHITTVGDSNVVLAIQDNPGFTNSVGNSMTVNINGDGNNGLNGLAAASFSGIALAAANLAPSIERSVLIAPDATLLVSSLRGTINLVPGLLVQLGDNNTMDIDVGAAMSSDNNLFAAEQKGNGNLITASINGSNNQFIVSQIGDDNMAAINQFGSGNIAVIRQ
ncbi:curlin repeat-containing protein [Devosia rhodophyticola]|uniref:Curlin repeat-containing protein n=1 Tax=Devosia rhodophyticola TaxID=3026423 RepID=A0ABY7YVZ4_9HYPH|nr:curlin repeat-containing protein [Devosia rhodophyticola]WDR05526.1 curlin repeat-containing protein [Devosia rhodophyticola]